jgi:hypothetical protein
MYLKFGGKVGQESIRRGQVVIDIDRDDHQSIVAVLRLHRIHPGKRLSAGSAPRRPEVDEYDLPGVVMEGKPGRRSGRIDLYKSGKYSDGGQPCIAGTPVLGKIGNAI